jgi:hypothetical protein
MSFFMDSNRTFTLLGRVALTIAVGSGAAGSILIVSAAVTAVEHIDRTDTALADLSHDIADGHASILGRATTPGSSVDAALVPFEKAVDRGEARLRNLNILIEQRADASAWTQPLQGNVDVQRIEEERRAYVTAVLTTPTTAVNDLAMRMRMFDLHARKLILTVATVRDSADAARARALFAARGMVALSSGLGGLLIAYLIWYPVFGGARQGAGATPLANLTDRSQPAFAGRDTSGWLHSVSSSRLL